MLSFHGHQLHLHLRGHVIVAYITAQLVIILCHELISCMVM